MFTRFLTTLLALGVVAAACTGDSDEPLPTSMPPAVVTTAGPTTVVTTTMPPPSPVTTAAPLPTPAALRGDLPEDLAEVVAQLYDVAAGIAAAPANLPAGLERHLADVEVPLTPVRQASYREAELPTGAAVAVVLAASDLFLAVDEGDGWEIVGAAFGGREPWLMEEPGLLLVIGSDARVGQLQPRFRADSIHLLALAPSRDAGTIVGFPRDTYISKEIIAAANAVVGLPEDDLPSAGIKWTNLMAGRGPEIMLETARELTGLPIDGYILTGFLGFETLIDELGGLRIDLPTDLNTGNNWENFSAGSQVLTPRRALQLARIRKGLRGGDFARSLNQGLIVLAAMAMTQEREVDELPELVQFLAENTFTNLDAGELLAFAASGLLMSPAGLSNVVLPGDVTTIDRRSVVLLHEEEKANVLSDIADDGVLEEDAVP